MSNKKETNQVNSHSPSETDFQISTPLGTNNSCKVPY